MPRRLAHVVYAAGVGPSARRLNRALRALNYQGPLVNWGCAGGADIGFQAPINSTRAVALASNKRRALETMRAAGVPCPREVTEATRDAYPYVMRSDRHHAGSGFWLVTSDDAREEAEQQGATHAMQYIQNAREFRVHIAFGKSIKLTEKLYNMGDHEMQANETASEVVRSHANGWRHLAPRPNAHKVTLRRHAKAAVQALGLDLGAVDILMAPADLATSHDDNDFYVLEVNTAPGFTGEADTATRYARAITAAHQP